MIFQLLHLFHGLNQINIPLLIGHHKHPHHFLIHPLIPNLHMLTQISLHQQHHLVKHIILQLHRKIFHMMHYSIHLINNNNNNNNIKIYLQQPMHHFIILIKTGDMFLKIHRFFGQL
jgi:hypothetical protein